MPLPTKGTAARAPTVCGTIGFCPLFHAPKSRNAKPADRAAGITPEASRVRKVSSWSIQKRGEKSTKSEV